MRHILRSKKGVAIEWAIVFGLVIFGLISLLLIGMSSFRNSISISDTMSQQRFDLDQIGEYFIRAISCGGEFPTGDEDSKNDFNDSGFLWMDSEAIDFFLEANKNYRYSVTTLTSYIKGLEGFLTFYSENGCSAKLEVFNKKDSVKELAIVVEEDYDYDVSGLLFRNPILFRDMDGTGTVYQIVEWTVNDTVAQSGSKLNGLQKLWGWIGGLFGNRGEGTNNTWSITYELNGGKGSGYVTCQKGASVTLPLPTKLGNGFLGWYDAKGAKVGDSGSTYKPSRSVKLYAKWAPYTVSFDASSNGGACAVSSVEGYVESLPAATIADEFKEFDGWYTAKEGGTRVGGAGDDFNPTSSVTLYAQFETVKYSIIKFVVNGNTVHQHTLDEATEFNLQEDTAQAIDAGVLATKKGYRFAGWKNSVDGKIYAGDEMLNINKRGAVVMTAQWAGYTVTYDAGEGGKVTGSGYTTAYDGGAWNWPDAVRSGYVLTGWMIGGKTYKLTDKTYVPLEDVTAKAVWEENSCTFLFVCDGVKVAEKTVRFSESYTLDVPDQEMAGCRFDGWKLNKIMYVAGEEVKAAGVDMSGEITLTASFTPWAIHFDVGTNGEGAVADMSGIITVPAAPAAKKDADGYERYYFIVWKDQNGQQYAPGTTLTPTGETTLTAQWSENPLVVLQYHLNGDGASVVGGWSTVVLCEPGTAVTLPAKTDVSRKGYEFSGWYLTPACDGDKVTSLTVTEDTHLFAKWTENVNDATFDANGGKVKDAAGHELDELILKLCYTDAEVTPAAPWRDGYVFMGWCTDKNGDGEKLAAGAAFKAANTEPVIAVYYAVWEPITVTLNANGGTLTGSDALTYSATMLSELKASTVNRLGYAFAGWYTAAEGGERVDDKSAWYPTSANTILYAHWTPYTITLEANGGILSGNTTVNYYDGYILPVPTRTGYKFAGWTDGTAAVYSTTAKINAPSGNITLTATWTGHKITYNVNGGNSISPAFDYYSDSLTLPTVTRPGYTFAGWKSSADDKTYAAGAKINVPDGDVTVTAQWAMATYTIQFDYNGGSKKDKDYSALTGLTIESTKNVENNKYQSIPSRYHISFTNYNFNGWNTKADATGDHFADGASVKDIISKAGGSGTTITLYAEWTYTVSFNRNDGSGSMADQTFYYNRTQLLNKNSFTRSGYHFIGWATSSSDSALVAYTDGKSIPGTEKVNGTLYAKWAKDTYLVNFLNDAGKVVDSQSFTVGESQNLKDVPALAKTGYVLTWVADNGNEYKYNQSVRNLSTQNGAVINMRARLEIASYKITVDTNNSTVTMKIHDGATISSGATVPYQTQIDITVSFSKDENRKFSVKSGDTVLLGSESGLGATYSGTFNVPAGDVTIEASSGSGGCFIPGTLITLADGTEKKIEDITPDDLLLAFNHETGCYEPTPAFVIVKSPDGVYDEIKLVFDCGADITLVNKHGLFDYTLMQYVEITPENAMTFIGHEFVVYNGETGENEQAKLATVEVIRGETTPYSLISYRNINVIANGLLTVSDEIEGLYNIFRYDPNLQYNAQDMADKIAKYGISSYEDWAEWFTYEQYLGFELDLTNIAFGEGLTDKEHHIRTFFAYYEFVVQ